MSITEDRETRVVENSIVFLDQWRDGLDRTTVDLVSGAIGDTIRETIGTLMEWASDGCEDEDLDAELAIYTKHEQDLWDIVGDAGNGERRDVLQMVQFHRQQYGNNNANDFKLDIVRLARELTVDRMIEEIGEFADGQIKRMRELQERADEQAKPEERRPDGPVEPRSRLAPRNLVHGGPSPDTAETDAGEAP